MKERTSVASNERRQIKIRVLVVVADSNYPLGLFTILHMISRNTGMKWLKQKELNDRNKKFENCLAVKMNPSLMMKATKMMMEETKTMMILLEARPEPT